MLTIGIVSFVGIYATKKGRLVRLQKVRKSADKVCLRMADDWMVHLERYYGSQWHVVQARQVNWMSSSIATCAS